MRAVTRVIYRDLLRSSRRIDLITRAEHVPVISELVQQFSDEQSTAVHDVIRQHGEVLPMEGLVRHAFRALQQPPGGDASDASDADGASAAAVDSGLRALRTIGLVEQFVQVDHAIHTNNPNRGAESVSAQPRARLLADAIIGRAH